MVRRKVSRNRKASEQYPSDELDATIRAMLDSPYSLANVAASQEAAWSPTTRNLVDEYARDWETAEKRLSAMPAPLDFARIRAMRESRRHQELEEQNSKLGASLSLSCEIEEPIIHQESADLGEVLPPDTQHLLAGQERSSTESWYISDADDLSVDIPQSSIKHAEMSSFDKAQPRYQETLPEVPPSVPRRHPHRPVPRSEPESITLLEALADTTQLGATGRAISPSIMDTSINPKHRTGQGLTFPDSAVPLDHPTSGLSTPLCLMPDSKRARTPTISTPTGYGKALSTLGASMHHSSRRTHGSSALKQELGESEENTPHFRSQSGHHGSRMKVLEDTFYPRDNFDQGLAQERLGNSSAYHHELYGMRDRASNRSPMTSTPYERSDLSFRASALKPTQPMSRDGTSADPSNPNSSPRAYRNTTSSHAYHNTSELEEPLNTSYSSSGVIDRAHTPLDTSSFRPRDCYSKSSSILGTGLNNQDNSTLKSNSQSPQILMMKKNNSLTPHPSMSDLAGNTFERVKNSRVMTSLTKNRSDSSSQGRSANASRSRQLLNHPDLYTPNNARSMANLGSYSERNIFSDRTTASETNTLVTPSRGESCTDLISGSRAASTSLSRVVPQRARVYANDSTESLAGSSIYSVDVYGNPNASKDRLRAASVDRSRAIPQHAHTYSQNSYEDQYASSQSPDLSLESPTESFNSSRFLSNPADIYTQSRSGSVVRFLEPPDNRAASRTESRLTPSHLSRRAVSNSEGLRIPKHRQDSNASTDQLPGTVKLRPILKQAKSYAQLSPEGAFISRSTRQDSDPFTSRATSGIEPAARTLRDTQSRPEMASDYQLGALPPHLTRQSEVRQEMLPDNQSPGTRRGIAAVRRAFLPFAASRSDDASSSLKATASRSQSTPLEIGELNVGFAPLPTPGKGLNTRQRAEAVASKVSNEVQGNIRKRNELVAQAHEEIREEEARRERSASKRLRALFKRRAEGEADAAGEAARLVTREERQVRAIEELKKGKNFMKLD